jgi:hypothetical protein
MRFQHLQTFRKLDGLHSAPGKRFPGLPFGPATVMIAVVAIADYKQE